MQVLVKQNDTKVDIPFTCTYLDNTIPNLTGATVKFTMGTSHTLVTFADATITDAANGKVSYTLIDSDTLLPGLFNAEFEVTFADGKIRTFPINGYIQVNILPDVDKSRTAYALDGVAKRVSDIQAILDEFTASDSTPEVSAARVEADGTTNANLKARLDKKDALFTNTVQTIDKTYSKNVYANMGVTSISSITATDFNSLITSGHYFVANNGAANSPVATWGYLDVYVGSFDSNIRVKQVFTSDLGGAQNRFSRANYQGTWSPWVRDVTSINFSRIEQCTLLFFTNGGSNTASATFTFGTPFSETPVIMPANITSAVPWSDVIYYPFIYSPSTTGFGVKIITGGGNLGTPGTPANLFMNFIVLGK